jgi:pimeloyl-[acyl-carrier protein] synthase
MTMPDAPGFALFSPEFRTNPYPFYHQLRAMDPVLWVPGVMGRGVWIVTGYHECSSALRDHRLGKEGYRALPPDQVPPLFRSLGSARANMLFKDPPDHTRLRGLVNQAFTPRVLERLRPHIQEIAEQLISQIAAGGEAELITAFAFPLPVIVIAELLGVPPEERDRFKAWSGPLAATTDPTATPEMVERSLAAVEELNAFFQPIIAERRRAPRQDLISLLAGARDAGDKLSEEELLATCRLLLVAGHETTVNLIGNATLALLKHPDQRALLTARPELIPAAVEELLRYDSPVQLTGRFALEDADLGGHAIRPGDTVLAVLGAANRDPAQFPDPDQLDLTRPNAGSHVSFSQGIHYCLGAPLARMEGQIALSALLRRLPGLALAGGELEYRGNMTLRGLQRLPVTF